MPSRGRCSRRPELLGTNEAAAATVGLHAWIPWRGPKESDQESGSAQQGEVGRGESNDETEEAPGWAHPAGQAEAWQISAATSTTATTTTTTSSSSSSATPSRRRHSHPGSCPTQITRGMHVL